MPVPRCYVPAVFRTTSAIGLLLAMAVACGSSDSTPSETAVAREPTAPASQDPRGPAGDQSASNGGDAGANGADASATLIGPVVLRFGWSLKTLSGEAKTCAMVPDQVSVDAVVVDATTNHVDHVVKFACVDGKGMVSVPFGEYNVSMALIKADGSARGHAHTGSFHFYVKQAPRDCAEMANGICYVDWTDIIELNPTR